MRAFLFPGQGSQHVGMGDGLFDRFGDLTETADDILGYSIKTLCGEDPDNHLGQTQYTQPALFVVNAMTARAKREDEGLSPDYLAGHSVGEYNALEFAGVFDFADGLRLVQKRGALMATAPKGTMAAVMGLPVDDIRQLLIARGLDTLDIANLNSDKQTILSGLVDDIEKARDVFSDAGAMYVPLNVSGAFHSRYMAGVQDAFAEFLAEFQFATPTIPVIANVDAQPYGDDVVAILSRQLTSSVLWRDSVTFMLDAGVREFVETGPGTVLDRLCRGIKADHDVAPRSIEPAVSNTPEDAVASWNATNPIGTSVRATGHEGHLKTRTEAMILFGHRAAIYLDGFNGYFALSDIEAMPASE